MRSRTHLATLLAATGLLAGQQAAPPDRDPAGRIIDQILAREREFLQHMKRLRPILETYIQETSESAEVEADAGADHYLLGKLSFDGEITHTPFLASAGFQRRSGGALFRRGGPVVFSAAGFAQMVVPDAESFNRATYHFDYVRREFLGDLRCLAFDLAPKDAKAVGKFIGRIWVEDSGFRIVRFNGTYTRSKASALFFHFDSWRVPVAADLYVPAFVYIEDRGASTIAGRRVRLKGQTRLWGYNVARTGKWEELTSILVNAENPVRDQSATPDASPVESQRSWTRQAEENVLDRLEKSALLAPKGDVDQVLNTVVNNLLVTNNINLEIQCRVLLTTPLETFSLGHTIVISRGLLDVLPDEASLAMVLSDEVAHIALGHRTETMFAFGDQTMFAEHEIIARLRLERSPQEVAAASARAVQILSHSPYKEKLANASLFLKALAAHSARRPHLIQANLGNQLASGDNLSRLAELAANAPALEESKTEQIAALPLGSRVKVDPWSSRITMIKARPVALLSAREKMPFEVAPILLHLTKLPLKAEAAKADAAVQPQ